MLYDFIDAPDGTIFRIRGEFLCPREAADFEAGLYLDLDASFFQAPGWRGLSYLRGRNGEVVGAFLARRVRPIPGRPDAVRVFGWLNPDSSLLTTVAI